MVVGHRGSGMNMLQSSDRRMKALKENSILSFNSAGKFNLDFIEFDVQVTNLRFLSFSFFLKYNTLAFSTVGAMGCGGASLPATAHIIREFGVG